MVQLRAAISFGAGRRRPLALIGLSAAISVGIGVPTSALAETTPDAGLLVVAVDGVDTNAGTASAPLATIQKAVDLVQPGQTIAIRGGTYTLTTNIQILVSGSSDAEITMRPFKREHVIIDGEQLPNTPAPVGGSIPRADRGAIHMEAAYWKISDLEIINGPYAVYCNACNNNTFERLVTHDNYETGFQLQGASSNNLILNLDSYNNRDPRKNGESADGLGIKEGSGDGNVVRGARLWNNVDDGFDAWKFLSPITVEESVAWGNGYNRWDFPNFAGDGNGFKMGGGIPDQPVAHTVRNSMSFGNNADGFTDNGNAGAMIVDHNTAYQNVATGFDFDSSPAVLTRNLAIANAAPAAIAATTTSTENSWDLPGTWDESSVVSTDSSVITGPRTRCGAIRHSPFLIPRGKIDLGARI